MKVCNGKVNNCDYWRPKENDLSQFDTTIWAKHNTQVAMEQNLGNYDFSLNNSNVKTLKKNTDNVIKSHKCNQCDFASSRAGNLSAHLKTHRRVKQM